ncbi:MAG: cyclic-phosphate processing receiver domain-containing protein [Ktedonobacteraceae bacterium]
MTVRRIFTIESSHKVLILEDDGWERIPWFRKKLPQATMVRNPLQAIEALRARCFEVVFLDFDVPCPENRTGLHVAAFLAEMNFSGRVVVHSANPMGAFLMAKTLRVAGVVTAVSEFGTFGINESDTTRFNLGDIR